MYISICLHWDSNTYFIEYKIVNLRGFMCCFERKTCNLILKFREIFPWRETVLRVHRIKSDEKLFLDQIYAFFEKNGTCCD